MEMFKLILFILFTSTAAVGQQKIIEGQYGRNSKQLTNYVKNAGCWVDTSNITASGGSLTRNTTSPLNTAIGADCKIDASASAQTYTWAFKSFDPLMKGLNCQVTFKYQGDASLYKAYVKQGSVKITVDQQLISSTSLTSQPTINFPCGDGSSATTFVIESTSSSAAAVQFTDVEGTLATNVGTVAQAVIAGESYFTGMTSLLSAYTASTTVPANYNTAADIPGPTIDFSTMGNWATTDVDTYAQTITNLPPGTYEASFEGNYYEASGSGNCSHGITDGTTSKGWQYPTVTGAGSAGPLVSHGTFVYTTAQASVTFRPQVLSCGSSSVNWYPGNSGNRVRFQLKYYPSQSQTAVRMDNTNYDWTSYTPSNTQGFGTISNVECQHKRDNADLLLRCKFTSGTVTGSEAQIGLPGILVSASTTKIPSIQSAGGAFFYGVVSGTYSVVLIEPSKTYVTFGIQGAGSAGLTKAAGSSVSSNSIVNTFTARIPIEGWTDNQNAPLIVGGVTSSNLGTMRVESLAFGGASETTNCTGSPCTLYRNNSVGITVTRIGSGNYSINFPTGMFSAPPTCVVNGFNGTTRVGFCGLYNVAATATVFPILCQDAVGTQDLHGDIMCSGPR